MTDVFISYSRLDKEFVGQLREALIAETQDVWIDWEDIPPSQAWWDEIKKGIARTNNFVVVLTPNSMSSPICQMEIEYARQLRKRLIPVMHTDFDREECLVSITRRLAKSEETTTREIWGSRQLLDVFDANDTALKLINYFFFRADADFPTRFNELFAVIRTDYEHKEQHTTLQLRAQEWDRRGRDPSFLLLDAELENVQTWLKASPGKEPVPTDLQLAYIQASETRTRQLRNVRRAGVIATLAAALALVFAVGASIVGLNASNNANQASTREAMANTQVAANVATLHAVDTQAAIVATQVEEGRSEIESLRLAALANGDLSTSSGNREIAALLGIRALRSGYTEQADEALVSALDSLYVGKRFEGHNGSVQAAQFSPDGRNIVSGSNDGTVTIWSVVTGKATRILTGGTGAVLALAYSPDGRFIAGAANTDVFIWNTVTGEQVAKLPGQTDAVRSLAFSPDGRFIATGMYEEDKGAYKSKVRVWETTSGNEVHVLDTDGTLRHVAYSPDSQYIIGPTWTTVHIWDAETGESVRTVEGSDLIYSPDSRYVAVITTDRASIRNAADDQEVSVLDWKFILYNSLVFSPDGRFMLSASLGGEAGDDTIRLWDTLSGQQIWVRTGYDASSAAFSPDGRFIVVASLDGNLYLWDTQTREMDAPATDFQYPGRGSAVYSPDNRLILSLIDESVSVWDTATGKEIPYFEPYFLDYTERALFSPNGNQVITIDANAGADNFFHFGVWNISTEPARWLFSGEYEWRILDTAFSPDGRFIFMLPYGEPPEILDAATGEVVQVLNGATTTIGNVAYSSDGRFVVTSGGNPGDYSARVWDVVIGDQVRVLEHSSPVLSTAFSPDDHFIVTSSEDGSTQIWDATNGDNVHTLIGDSNRIVRVFYSPDGRYVATTSSDPLNRPTTRVWDAETGELIQTQPRSEFADFSPDSRSMLLLSGSTVRIIDIVSGQVSRVLHGHVAEVGSAQYNTDGRLIVTASSGDNLVRVWDADYHAFIDYACTYVFRDFTPEERVQFGITDDAPTCPQFAPDFTPPPTS